MFILYNNYSGEFLNTFTSKEQVADHVIREIENSSYCADDFSLYEAREIEMNIETKPRITFVD